MKALAYACFAFAGLFLALFAWDTIATGEVEIGAGGVLMVLVPLVFGIGFVLLAPRFASKFDTPMRVTVFVLGVLAILVGFGWSAYAQEYGTGANYVIEETGGTASVYLVDEASGGQELEFTGTPDEALRYTEESRTAGVDLTLPRITVVAGAAVTVAAMAFGWRRTGD
jgi:ABC-type transport system involved in cytochrome bd biosynthesis fused ATPase/permease subunit